MKRLGGMFRTDERQAVFLAAVIVAQTLCAVFFIGDVLIDVADGGHLDDVHIFAEAAASLILGIGILYMLQHLRRLYARMRGMSAGLEIARGELAAVIDGFFDSWKLTPSERDVALLIVKGLDNDSIARLRGTASGTVRAQASSVYRKAGVDGRVALLSLFMDELLELEPLAGATPAAPPGGAPGLVAED